MKPRLLSILLLCFLCVGVVFPHEIIKIDESSKYNLDTNLIDQIKNNIPNYVEIENIPIHLKQAIISTEDKRFYFHRGFDIIAIVRALYVNFAHKTYKQGASTITQQLVKNLFLTNEKTLKRKIKEFLLSLELERQYSKNDILEMYLNIIYFGSGVYGIHDASYKYFGKEVKDLTLSECSMLAGIPKAPTRYAPDKNYQAAKRRQALVLSLMEKNGYINAELKTLVQSQKLKLIQSME